MGLLIFLIIIAVLVHKVRKAAPSVVRFGVEHPGAVKTGAIFLKRLFKR